MFSSVDLSLAAAKMRKKDFTESQVASETLSVSKSW